MTANKHAPTPWQAAKCQVPMWLAGSPSGNCGEAAFGHQYPQAYLLETRYRRDRPYCFGHCCPAHGGPREGEPIIFDDGYTSEGRQMWCAVMPDFINLQESPAGFSGNPAEAERLLRAAIAKAGGAA